MAPKDMLERCIALRISGRAEVRSGQKRAQVDLLGGDVVGIDGVDPETLIEWRAGSFRVLQSLPDFDGRLTDDRERRGLLAEIDSTRLFAWAQQHQLSVTVELQSGARHALVEVENGRIINASEGGRPASASQMQGWRAGTYCVSLLPLFPEQSVRISVAPLPEVVVAKGTGSHGAIKRTNGTNGTNGTAPHARVPELTPPEGVLMGDAILPSQKKNRAMRAVVMGGLVVGAAGLILIATSKNAPKPAPAAVAAAAEPDKAEPPKADPAKADPAKTESTKAETAKAETPKPEAAEPKKPSAADKADATRLAQQAQGLLLTGKRAQAMPLLDKAQKLDPENALAKTAVAQARGEGGDGMLVIASKPRADKILIDGTPMGKTPLKLKKVPVGTHTVQVGSAEPQDVEVVKGKKKVVLFKLAGKARK